MPYAGIDNIKIIIKCFWSSPGYRMSHVVYFEVKVGYRGKGASSVHTGSYVNYALQVIYVIRFVVRVNYKI